MRRYSYALTLLLLTQGAALLAQTPVVVSAQRQAQIKQAYLDLPLSFERQGDGANERYVARGNGYLVGLDKGRVVIELPAAGTSAKDSAGKLLSLDFTGGQPARAVPEGELAGKVNRYRGGDRNRWQTGLSTYSRVTYKDVYPGIDVVYYGNQQQLEFDFVVKPGADPGAIRMKVGGARDLKIDEAGALVIDEGGRKLKIALPAVYQDIVSQNGKGGRKKIAGRYKLRGSGEVAFALDSWDRTQPLVIDPTLVYSALIDGGTSSAFGNAIAVDGSGNIYLAGYTYATDFPTVNAAQPGPASAPDGFVTKINSSGTALIFSTFLGGSSTDYLTGVAYDSTGAAWVTGYTVSTDFPLMNATQNSYGGTGDAVVAKLGATGALQFSTYLGGTGYEYGYGIAVDSANNAYVTGVTESSNFPTTSGALQTTISSGENAYVTKFGSTGTLVYSTFFGGTSGETGTAIAVDSTGSAYITGYSASLTVNGQPGGARSP